MPNLPFAFFAVALLACLFALLISRLFARLDSRINDAEWLESFSFESYRPMERLLQETDYIFLASQPGYRPEIAKQLRAERARIFRSYLGHLTGDFTRLVRVANLMLIHSKEDRPDWAREISRLRFAFYFAVVRAQVRLTFGAWPTSRPQVADLVGPLEAIFRMIAPVSTPAERS